MSNNAEASATKKPAQKSLADLQKELDKMNIKIEQQRMSIRNCPRGFIPPYMGEKILDWYIKQKIELEKQIEDMEQDEKHQPPVSIRR